jgi:hypothetical protein
MVERCGNCKYFWRALPTKNKHTEHCRRFPPSAPTYVDNWCGEWELDPSKTTAAEQAAAKDARGY